MPYVSARYMSPPPGMPPAAEPQVVATDENGTEWFLTEDSQVGDWQQYLANGGTIDPAVVPPPPDPVLNQVNRAVGIIGNQPVAVTCHGANFLPTSVVFVDNKLKRNSVFISSEAIACTIDPLNETARTVEVYVKTGTHNTNKLPFTFITREAPV